ncbi:DUF1697 domain-containing protein [Macrococcus equi]|uniref:DUF1697 domain-containing protein n=1 Tax=Macrococcus equi TaxID=3395462 RepID=UPI0039BECCA4
MFVCLLRGVNVNGIKIKNVELKAVFESLGFTDVTPILQTGNVIYNTTISLNEQKDVIETALRNKFGYEAFVIVRDGCEMQTIINNYPFDLTGEMQPYVIFVNSDEVKQELLALPIDENESVHHGNNVIYWTVPKGKTLDSKFGKVLGQKKYKSETTTRNLRTVEKIVTKIK